MTKLLRRLRAIVPGKNDISSKSPPAQRATVTPDLLLGLPRQFRSQSRLSTSKTGKTIWMPYPGYLGGQQTILFPSQYRISLQPGKRSLSDLNKVSC